MWLNKDKDWTEKIQGILGGALMGDQGLPGPDYIQNLIGQSNIEPGKLSIGGLLKTVAGNMNKSGGLTQHIAKNIGEGGASNIVNKKNMPWLYDNVQDALPKGTKDIPGEVEQLKIPGVDWDKVTNPMQRALQIAHGAPRYIRGVKPPSGVINKAPHLDSPFIDEQIRRNWKPQSIPGPGGPSLPDFVRGVLPDDDIRNLLIRTVA